MATITGSIGDDVLIGTSGDDTYSGFTGGNDVVYDFGGYDTYVFNFGFFGNVNIIDIPDAGNAIVIYLGGEIAITGAAKDMGGAGWGQFEKLVFTDFLIQRNGPRARVDDPDDCLGFRDRKRRLFEDV